MSLLGAQWQIKNTTPGASLLQKLLENRGLTTDEAVQHFFHPDAARDFHDPYLMKDMARAVARIAQAIESGQRIMIFGDYDVDGITGSAILMRCLRTLGANVSYRLPHRVEDGYGLREKFIHEFKKLNVGLIITVDNGISCATETALAQSMGIDVIITDHHTIPTKIPPAFAILHPKLADSGYPFSELTGAGVALKLAQALFISRHKNHEEETLKLFDLACMGTIADLGELKGENRYIVKRGLEVLHETRWPGLSRLKERAGLRAKISSHDIGFVIGPRINAAGRMSHPRHALNLLLNENGQTAALAENLERLNRQRQKLMEELMKVAEPLAESQRNDALMIIYHPSFHAGVLGLLAAKVSEKFERPTIAMEEREETLVGSCRSPSINMVDALTESASLLIHFGGHAAAAGFEISKKNLPVFIERIKKHAADRCDAHGEKVLLAECEISAEELSEKTMSVLTWFEPFGMGNERPRFICKNLPLLSCGTVGKEKNHLKLRTKSSHGFIEAIGFRVGHFEKKLKGSHLFDALFELEKNEWQGTSKLQLRLIDVAPVV